MTITHTVAQCQDCEWRNEDYLTAKTKARIHSKKMMHRVVVETGNVVYYNNGDKEL